MVPEIHPFFVPILQVIVFVSSLVVTVLAEPAINRMSPCSPFLTRIAFHCLTVGGAGNALYVAIGDRPNWPETIIIAGVALLLVRDRIRHRVAHDLRARPLLDQDTQ